MRRRKWGIRLGILLVAIIVFLFARLERSTLSQVRTLEGHTDSVFRLQFSSDGRWLVSASFDKTARLWEVASGKQLAVMTHPAEVTGLAIHPTGKWCATIATGTVRLWSLPEGKVLREIDRPLPVRAMSLSGDGRFLACGEGKRTGLAAAEPAPQGAVEVLDTETWESLHPAREVPHPVTAIALSSDGNLLAFKENSPEHRLYLERLDGSERTRISPVRETELAWSPDGQSLLVGGGRIWRYDGQRLEEAPPVDAVPFSDSGAFSADGKRIALAGSGPTLINACPIGVAVIVGPPKNHVVGRAVEGDPFGFSANNRETIYCVAFSPDGDLLATGSGRGHLRLWKIPPK